MAFPILGTPKPQFSDSSGSPLVTGTLSVLEPADDTNKASYPTYDDAEALTNANVNPIVLDGRGEPPDGLFGLDGEDYKLVLKDSLGATIWTTDDVFVPVQVNQVTSEESAASVTPTDPSYPPGDVRRYGAVGDGTTNDYSAFDQAIRSTSSGGTVYIPAGTYAIASLITIASSEIKFQGDGSKSIVKASSAGYDLFTAAAQTDLTFEDIRFEGAETTENATYCFKFLAGCDRVIIKNCIFSGPNGTTGFNSAIDLVGCDAALIDGCYFERLIGTNSGNGYGILTNTDCLYPKVVNNTFELTVSAAAGGRHAIYFSDGTKFAIASNNAINNCANEAITLFSTAAQNTQEGTLLVNNMIRNTTHRAIGATENVKGAVIVGNHISNTDTNSAIRLEGSASAQPSHCIIADNYIEETDQQGIWLNASDDCVVSGNIIKGFSLQTVDTYFGILVNQAAASGAQRNIIDGNYVIQEATQALSGIRIGDDATGTVVQNNVVTGSYSVADIEDDAVDTATNNNQATVVRTSVTGTVTIPSRGWTGMNISSAVTATLGSGVEIGDIKTVVATAGSTASTLSVTNHETSDPEVFNFAAANDTVVLMWTGFEWITLATSGATV